MSEKKITILASCVLVLVLFIVAKAYLKPSNGISSLGNNNTGLKTQYNSLIESGKPSMVIFSYDADCWPTTKVFFEEYNTKVRELTAEYENKMGILYINVGILNEAEYDDMMEIAKKNNVDELPSILLLDSKGEYKAVVAGKFVEEDMVKKIQEIIQ